MDHIDLAVHATVHESKFSAKEIAQRIGMSNQVLINKANPQSEFHKLTLREALAIQLLTGNHRIHSAMGVELGLCVDDGPPKKLLESVLDVCREHGDVVRVIQESIEDGIFTDREKEACQKEIDEAVAALDMLRQVIIKHDEQV